MTDALNCNGDWWRLPGLLRGRLHSARLRAMKPRSGSASLAPTRPQQVEFLAEDSCSVV